MFRYAAAYGAGLVVLIVLDALWLTLAGALSIITAAGPAFFKSGPFAYHGLLAFYMPVVVWGAYISGTTWFMLQELKRSADRPEPVASVA